MTKAQAKAHKLVYAKALDEGRIVRFDGLTFREYHTAAEAAHAVASYEGVEAVIVRVPS